MPTDKVPDSVQRNDPEIDVIEQRKELLLRNGSSLPLQNDMPLCSHSLWPSGNVSLLSLRIDSSLLQKNDTSLLQKIDASLLQKDDSTLLQKNDFSAAPPATQISTKPVETVSTPILISKPGLPNPNGEGNNQSGTVSQVQSLDEKMLELIGKRIVVDKIRSSPIDDNIAVRWVEILKEGLPKEERTTLCKRYPTPENVTGIEPAKINPEIKASLHETVINRDLRMVAQQEKSQRAWQCWANA